MKKIILITMVTVTMNVMALAQSKMVSKDGSVNFFSHTVAEDISSNNYTLTSTIDPSTGAVVFIVPMQGFEFEISMMQKHFNSNKFLDTKAFPKGKFVGNITNIKDVKFGADGVYNAKVVGELTLHGVTNTIETTGTISVAGGVSTVDSKFQLTLADFEIAFEKGKPSTNVAKVVDVTVKSVFK